MPTAIASSITMDGYGQSSARHNFYSFNLLQPSYHQEQQFTDEFSFDDGFGFDPRATEQITLGQFPDIGDLLSSRTCPPPCQLSPARLIPQSSDLARVSIGQTSSGHVAGPFTGAGGISAVLEHDEVRLLRAD